MGQQGWTAGPASDTSAWTPGPAEERSPDFKTTNAVDEQGNPIVRFAKEAGAQLNPITAVTELGKTVLPPQIPGSRGLWTTAKQIGAAQGALYDKAKTAYDKGDYVGAAAHFINYLLPLVGPSLDVAGEKMRKGDIAGGAGQAIGLGLAMFGPEAVKNLPPVTARTPPLVRPQLNPQEAAAVQYGARQGIPIDAATATGSPYVAGVQKLTGESMGGSVIAGRFRAQQAEAIAKTGERLAARPVGIAVTEQQAGQNVIDALTSKIQAHKALADNAYDRLRAIEADPAQVKQVRVVSAQTRGVPATVQMALPINLQPAKQALTPIYQQLERQYPLTRQQASPGFKALENIVRGPNYAPLSQVDRDLSALKTIAREEGGVTKLAVAEIDKAVQKRAAQAGPTVLNTLQQGRGAVKAGAATSELLERVRAEPVQAYRQLVAPKDSGIEFLRSVAAERPDIVPGIARAYLENLMQMATAEGGFERAARLQAEWQRLGPSTKQILFPAKGQVQALDNFFLLAKRVAENPNPSGTAATWMKGGELIALLTNPQIGVPATAASTAIAKLLHSPAGVRALTQGVSLTLSPSRLTPAVQVTVAGNILKALQEADSQREQ